MELKPKFILTKAEKKPFLNEIMCVLPRKNSGLFKCIFFLV